MEINEQDDANKSSHSDGLLTETTTISTIKSTDENILKSSSYDVLPQKNENEKEIEIENDENKELVYNNNNNVDDTNVDVLTNKVPVADDENVNNNIKTATVNGDGSDSGVEIGAATNNNNNNVLQRALSSSNSGGYTSSCGGIEDNIGPISCNSSMISYCSDTCDKTNSTVVLPDFYASEGGSESSSVTGDPTFRKLNSGAKKKVAVKEGNNKSPRRSNESNSSGKSSIRSRPPSVNRSQSLSIKSGVPSLMTRERARSRDKNKIENPTFITPQKSLMTTSLTRSMSLKRPPKPDSLSLMGRDTNNLSPRVNLSRTPSLTRGRTPHATPTNCDDGRWPSVGNKTATQTPRVVKTNNSAAATPTNSDTLIIRTRIGNIQLDNKSSTFDKYATLPRRRKERSVENLTQAGSRSSSTTRNNPDTLPNRMTNSVVKKLPSSSTPNKSLPAYPKIAKKPLVPKTKIYHETSVQTAITCKDVDDAFSGNPKNLPRIDAVEMKTKETQSDIRDKEMEKLREQIDKMNADHSQLLAKLSEKSQTVSELEQELLKEKEEKLIAQKELQNNTERVMHMLNNFQAGPRETEKEGDSLLMLESQLMISGSVLEKQQDEIVKLQNICRTLQRDMEKSLKIQENLIRQKNELEEESTELQDFLQAEKVAFMDALKEAENENRHVKEKLSQRESELERQQEECRHLVRICEQRRQEYLGMQAKYNALEGRSKDLLLSQGSAVSGANVALASLQSRIEHLVEQLISSYNISEQDLEDIVFFNDAYANSSSSGDGSPELETAKTTPSDKSPQRNQSFLTAVINAIKNATMNKPSNHNNNGKQHKDNNNDDEDSTEMLDSETEPCLMMENVLEDVQPPDSHSHNLVSTSQIMLSQIEIPSDILKSSLHDCHDGSLDNLSQAIVNRQQIELQTNAMHQSRRHNSERNSTSDDLSQESGADVPSIGDFYTAQSLVDQVIEVDNSITKLLKVLRLIQMDNDNCIQELVIDKNKIQVSKEETLEKLNEWEMINQKLKVELKEATQQLIIKSNELVSSKTELQRHRQEIDRLNQDICNLSTLCTENNEKKVGKDEILAALRVWQESGNLPEDEIVSHVVTACNEIPILKEKLREKERQLNEVKNNSMMNSTWHQAVTEAKRQYDAIDNALETLQSIQNIVKDCPQLMKLQHDLEETNFNTINTLPIEHLGLTNGNLVTADLNANEPSLNDSGNAQIINSTA